MKKIVVLCLIFALLWTQLAGAAQEPPDATAILFDVPIRVLGVGVLVLTGALFIVALPFTLTSWSFSDAWKVLLVEPFEFVFVRPLGKFDNWRVPVVEKRNNGEELPPSIQKLPSDNLSEKSLSPST